MSEQDQNKLKEQLAEKNAALEREQQARTAAEEEARKAKEALTAAEEEARKAKEALTAAEASKSQIKETLKKVREELSGVEGKGNDGPIRLLLKGVSPAVFYVIIAIFILFILYVVFFGRGTMLAQLRDVAYARGLITFIFSLGTIGIGIILTLAALAQGDEAGKAFTRGKEIFTILVGILGTIVGFYFGSAVEVKETGLKESLLTVAKIQVSNYAPNENSQIALSTEIRGGTPPYKIAISSEPKLIDPIVETRDTGGKYEKQLSLPLVDKDQKVKIELNISDKSGGEAKAEAATITIKNVD